MPFLPLWWVRGVISTFFFYQVCNQETLKNLIVIIPCWCFLKVTVKLSWCKYLCQSTTNQSQHRLNCLQFSNDLKRTSALRGRLRWLILTTCLEDSKCTKQEVALKDKNSGVSETLLIVGVCRPVFIGQAYMTAKNMDL